jgi:chorismate synthase
MAGSSIGRAFVVTTAGESHGPANVVIVDGCPAGLALSEEDLAVDLARRRPGQSRIVSQRDEADVPQILSGVFEGKTTGTPIAIFIANEDARSRDYGDIKDKYRPGHADFSYDAKYGFRDYRGGGRASARETVARVAAGAIARKLLARDLGARIVGYVVRVGDVGCDVADPAAVTREMVDANIVRCPDAAAAQAMIDLVDEVRAARDSIGGVAEIVATGVPAGLGEPVFDKLKADLARALFSIPAVVGVEYGAGFRAAAMRGSAHNDLFTAEEGRVVTTSNRHGGMLGGITTGMPIVMRAAVKPTSSLPQEQASITPRLEPTVVVTKGRHDPCLLPRFVPIAEAMVAIVLADHHLRQRWRERP